MIFDYLGNEIQGIVNWGGMLRFMHARCDDL